MTRPPARASSVPPRDRLLAAAETLFYAEGVHVVGIGRILREAGVAKASLYHHFQSKDGLVRAYLERQFAASREHLAEVVARAPDPRAKILAVFDDAADQLQVSAFRGCHFVNASVEAARDECVQELTEEYRRFLLELFTGLAGEAGADDAAGLGRQLALLYDGIAVAARVDSDRTGVAAAANSAARRLLDAALVDSRTRRPSAC